ncbi:MAG: Ig-like domain-containing protein [Candidatus Hadarchaeota archaeon]
MKAKLTSALLTCSMFISSISVLAAASVAGAASGQVIFAEDFNTLANGNLAGQAGWQDMTLRGTGGISVSSELPYEGAKGLVTTTAPPNRQQYRAYHTITPTPKGRATIYMRVQSGAYESFWLTEGTAPEDGRSVGYGAARIAVNMFGNINQLRFGSSPATWVVVSITPDTWYKVTAEWDASNTTAKAWVNDEFKGEFGLERAISNGIDGVMLDVGDQTPGLKVYYDAITVATADTVPPAAFDLISPANNSWVNITRPTLSWQASSDLESGIKQYHVFVDGSERATISGTTIEDFEDESVDSLLAKGWTKIQWYAGSQFSVETIDGDKALKLVGTPYNAAGMAYPNTTNVTQFKVKPNSVVLAVCPVLNSESGNIDLPYWWYSATLYTAYIWVNTAHTSLYKVVNGTWTVIAQANVGMTSDQWHDVALSREGTTLKVTLDGATLIEVNDPTPLAGDYSGFLPANYGAATMYVDDVYLGAGTTSWQVDYDLSEGSHSWYVTAEDQAGNITQSTSTFTVNVDTVPPTSSVNQIVPFWQVSAPFTVSATASDATSGVESIELFYRSSTDGVNWTEWQSFGTDATAPYEWSFTAPDGYARYEFYSVATDVAGNVESAPDVADVSCGLAIPATVDIDPDTLNLKSRGKWITAYIELPAGYSVGDINVGSLKLNGTVQVEASPIAIGDYNGNGVPDLMVKFSRSAVQALLVPGEATLTVTGEVGSAVFEGSDTIRVI